MASFMIIVASFGPHRESLVLPISEFVVVAFWQGGRYCTGRRLFMYRKRLDLAASWIRRDGKAPLKLDPHFLERFAKLFIDVSRAPPPEQKAIVLRELLDLVSTCQSAN
jgi:hypothetical protein